MTRSIAMALSVLFFVACSQESDGSSAPSSAGLTPASSDVHILAASDCHEYSCEGPLEPGRYRATYSTPSFEFEITSPGWTWVYSGSFVMVADPTGATEGPIGPDGIYFLRKPSIASRDCGESPEPDVGRSVDDLLAALEVTPGLTLTEPMAVTIGGVDGVQIDLEVDPAWKQTCVFSEGLPAVPLIIRGTDIGGYHWAIVRGQWMRWYILDTGEDVMIVDVEDGPEGLSRDELLQSTDEILASLEFSASS